MAIALRTLRVDADLDRLADVRAFVREAATSADAPVDCLDDLVQAVDEAAANAIVHGYRGRPGWLEVTVGFDGERFAVTIADEASAFDPTAYPEPDLAIPPERRKPGGMGVHLIRAASDEVSWQPRPGGGNILTLIRTRGERQQEE
jgi:serine/threonine-protein kinase RsbW